MLEVQDIASLFRQPSPHPHLFEATRAYAAGELVREQVAGIVQALGSVRGNSDYVWLAMGYGSQTKATYTRLCSTEGVRVLWSGRFVPWWLSPLSLIAASHGGLVEVIDEARLPLVIDELSSLAMVEAFAVSRDARDGVLEFVRQRRWRAFIGVVAGIDATYFCFGVDGDSKDASTGYYGWTSWGEQAPSQLVSAISPFVGNAP